MNYQLLVLALAACIVNAQTVDTLAQLRSDGDVAGGPNGVVYASDTLSTVYAIQADGSISVFADASDGLNSPRGLVFDENNGLLYVANAAGWITRIQLDGSADTLASGFSIPTGLALNDEGILFVCDHTNKVWMVQPDGSKEIYANSTTLNRPNGIAIDENKNLYVASAHDGNIYRIDESREIQHLAHVDGLNIPWACGYMTYVDQALFITNGDQIIHRIGMDGQVSDYAGTGEPGSQDGPISSAQFNEPNGIGRSLDGSYLYVAEFGKNRIRIIRPPGQLDLNLVLPWIVNNDQWSSEIGLYNASGFDQECDLVAVSRNGETMSAHIFIPKDALFSRTSDALFGDLTGYSISVMSESPHIYGTYLTFNLEAASGGRSPSETTACPSADLSQRILFGYLQSDEIPALVIVAPNGEADSQVNLELFGDNALNASISVTLHGSQPNAFLLSDVFTIESGMGAVAVIATSNDSSLLCGTAFIFNQMRQPSMAPAVPL